MSDALCEPLYIDLELRSAVSSAALYGVLVALGDSILDNLPIIYRDRPDDLERRLVAWGFSLRGTRIGIYGDYTSPDDDERLFPALARFLHPESRYIFDYQDHPERYGWWGWDFHDGRATLRKAERHIEWSWA